jgi:hypothetical protein
VFLSGWDDYRDRQRGIQVGADEFLSKQTPVRELLIRIHLLLQRYSDVGAADSRKPVMEGSIEVVGAAGVLQMWHQGRLSGVCIVRSGTLLFEARFRDGEIVYAGLGDRSGAQAVYGFLGWTRGQFRFVPGEVEAGAPIGETFDQLLLEGCRLLDETRHSFLERHALAALQQSQPLHLLVQRRRQQSERARGTPLIAGRGGERRLDQLTLVRVEQSLEAAAADRVTTAFLHSVHRPVLPFCHSRG